MTAVPSTMPSAQDLDGTTDPRNTERPLYGAGFGVAISRFFRQYASFTGRASRSEYWWAVLAEAILALIPWVIFMIGLLPAIAWRTSHATHAPVETTDGQTVDYVQMPGLVNAPTFFLVVVGLVLMVLVGLALIFPTLAISWRRLHDANLAGPFWFLTLIPSIGSLIVLILMLLPSKVEGRRFDRA